MMYLLFTTKICDSVVSVHRVHLYNLGRKTLKLVNGIEVIIYF